ncbi:MAG TPA: hypothetical protein VEV85_00070 [Bryobacteraceae bacterium]|nr:hypothetical protein [Bryobacteraceae bacterium]
MTELLAMGAIAAGASSITGLGFWAWMRLSPRKAQTRDFQASPEFSMERYAPMTRLLAGEDMQFLRKHACGKIAARWDRARRRVFRQYLRDLSVDFHRLHAQARALVSESPEQYSDLVGMLMRQQVAFLRAMAGVELRLAFHAAGIGTVDVRRLIGVIDSMRLELERSVALASA